MDEIISPVSVLLRAFPGIHPAEAETMKAAGDICFYPAGTLLCHEDLIESTFFVLLQGEVQVTKRINEKETRLLKSLRAGDFFGEMALIHNAPRAATVTTTTAAKVLEIQKEDFRNLLEQSNILSLTMVREVSRRLRENDQMAIEDLRMKASELAEAYEQLAEQEYARSQFLTTIAHELRTPLTTASGFMQVIRSGMLQGDALTAATETVARNLQDIVALTNDILFLQEMDLILPEFRAVDAGKVIVQAVDRLRSRAEKSSVGIRLEISPILPSIQGDSKSLERALTAILDNAIKYSTNGSEVRVEVRQNGPEVTIFIGDHGTGISTENLPHIFERFFHIDKIGDRLFRGAGIGLSIARAVIEQHQGQIEVESQVGVGSVFTVRLPVRQDK